MAKSEKQKLKLLYLIRFLWVHTDDNHGLTMEDLLRMLEAEGIKAERKSIYDDFESLREFGIDVVKYKKDRTWYYAWADRDFETPEIKILADLVWSSRFLTESKSRVLLDKLGMQLSTFEAASLRRQVLVVDRVKNSNEKIYYNLDAIHEAISENASISFDYMEMNEQGDMVVRKDGQKREVSPWLLVWENSNCYLVAYDVDKSAIRHYRVDRMEHVQKLKVLRKGKEVFEQKDLESYSQARFQMYDGEPVHVTISCTRGLLGAFYDMFGTDITVKPAYKDEEDPKRDRFEVWVRVAPTNVFFGWLAGLGSGAKLLSPSYVVDKMNTWLQLALRQQKSRQIRNVIFDLGMVLVDFRYDAYMKELKFPKAVRLFFEKHIILSDLWKQMDLGSLTMEQAQEKWCEMFPEQEQWIRRFFEDPRRLVAEYKDAEEWLSWCKEQGYRVYLLTNYPGDLFEMHKGRFHFLTSVDGYVVSAQERLSKPSEALYRTLLERFNLKPEESVFLDDRKENVDAANALGIYGIEVGNREQAWQELQAFLEVNRR